MDHPDITVQIGRERRRVRARKTTAEERPEFWDRAVSKMPAFAHYESRLTREDSDHRPRQTVIPEFAGHRFPDRELTIDDVPKQAARPNVLTAVG